MVSTRRSAPAGASISDLYSSSSKSNVPAVDDDGYSSGDCNNFSGGVGYVNDEVDEDDDMGDEDEKWVDEDHDDASDEEGDEENDEEGDILADRDGGVLVVDYSHEIVDDDTIPTAGDDEDIGMKMGAHERVWIAA